MVAAMAAAAGHVHQDQRKQYKQHEGQQLHSEREEGHKFIGRHRDRQAGQRRHHHPIGKNFAVERGFANFATLPSLETNEIIYENIGSDGIDAVCSAGLAGAVRRTAGAPGRAEGRQRGAALHRGG